MSSYLTSIHFAETSAFCTGVGDCETVNKSEYASIGPVPIAAIGLAGYVVTFLTVALAWLRPAKANTLVLAVFGIALIGVLYSTYLTYLELFVIDAICPWCVTSAVIQSAIFALAAREAIWPVEPVQTY